MTTTKASDDALALQRLAHWERTRPGAIALTQPMGKGQLLDLSWAQVADQARRMAAYLKDQGWPPGSMVAILSKNCAWWLISDLAIWMAGHVSVPLYPTLSAGTIAQILNHSEARACFIGKLDGWEAMKPGIPVGLPCIAYPLAPEEARRSLPGWDAICAAQAPLAETPMRRAEELCTLIYTSGTTGAPKGVMHTFGNFAWAVGTGTRRFTMGTEDRMLSYLPLAHVAERMLVEHGWLAHGLRVYFAETLETFAADLQRARPTLFFSVPRLWVRFQQGVHAKLPPKKLDLLLKLPIVSGLIRRKILRTLGLDQCRLAAGGAAPMPLALLDFYARLGLPVNEAYGMTENLGASHLTEPGKDQRGTVGVPYEGVEARIDPASGELQIRSPAMMLGYYKDEALTRETLLPDGWQRTGDKAELDAATGCWRITGRVKDLFKSSKGKYVAPAPIEDRLGASPLVEACVVTGANLNQPLGLAMLSPNASLLPPEQVAADLGAHLAALNAALDPHERLDCLVLLKTPWTVDNGLITPTFKVRRNRIEELYGARYEDWVGQGRPVVWGE
ncbi:AMP-binding protein [Pelomonas sp. KK5]|uniref:AMP-binding protein n=1 Tax=Pelomonas sp. KK5 TaxID=1855730 RepID=UPI001E36B19E|nr:AMP-binding protein [Pelomonas sp. KK5]